MKLRRLCLGWIVTFALALAGSAYATAQTADKLPERVTFPSLDGKTQLAGYVFMPALEPGEQTPAIVMLHGRAGPYSTLANGRYDASTLSKRHMAWGRFWAGHGYVALLVDSFGPRGFPEGFPIHSYENRPDTVNEVTVRPLDAFGALAYLRRQPFVLPAKIALQGWSNGGSATLAAMSDAILAENLASVKTGFAGAVAFYPACSLHDRFAESYHPYAPVRVFSGDNDEEVSAKRCAKLAGNSAREGDDIEMEIFAGATHGFDDPSEKRQHLAANRRATRDAIEETERFMRMLLTR